MRSMDFFVWQGAGCGFVQQIFWAAYARLRNARRLQAQTALQGQRSQMEKDAISCRIPGSGWY